MKLSPDGIRLYLAANTSSLRTPSSIRSYRSQLDGLARFCGHKDLSRYKETDLAGFCQQGNPAPKTVSLRRTVCRQFFRWARRAGLISVDPSIDLNDLVKVRVRTLRPGNWLTEGQVKLLLATCDDSVVGQRDRLALTLGFNTGLRASEIVGIHWDHVDLQHGRVAIPASSAKGEKAAVVGLSQGLSAALVAWREICPTGPIVPRTRNVSNFMDSRVDQLCIGIPLKTNGLFRVLSRRGLLIGVPHLAPHDMRRTLAGILQTKGYTIEQISEVLRHDSIATTQAYLEKNPHKAVKTLQGLELDI